MKSNALIWMAVVTGLVFVLSATGILGWTAAAVVAAALVLAFPPALSGFARSAICVARSGAR